MTYRTTCPKCSHQLYLHSATVYPRGVAIEADGFDLYSGKACNTEDETVACGNCDYCGDLEYMEED